MARKIIPCLPKNKWGSKVTTVKGVQDLKKLEPNEPLEKLVTHEIHLREDEGESSKEGIALKGQKKTAFQMKKSLMTMMKKHSL